MTSRRGVPVPPHDNVLDTILAGQPQPARESAAEAATRPARVPASARPETPRGDAMAPPADPVATAPAPAGARVPRLAITGLDATTLRFWRHQLRAAAGKLAAEYQRAAEAEDAWDQLAARASAEGVPESALLWALTDANLSDQVSALLPASPDSHATDQPAT
jgi:hypothetical protein